MVPCRRSIGLDSRFAHLRAYSENTREEGRSFKRSADHQARKLCFGRSIGTPWFGLCRICLTRRRRWLLTQYKLSQTVRRVVLNIPSDPQGSFYKAGLDLGTCLGVPNSDFIPLSSTSMSKMLRYSSRTANRIDLSRHAVWWEIAAAQWRALALLELAALLPFPGDRCCLGAGNTCSPVGHVAFGISRTARACCP